MIKGHRRIFKKIWANFEVVADECAAKGGKIAIEWPKGCLYWRYREVKKLLERHGLKKHSFHGCMYGLVSIRPKFKGMPIQKAWTIATNVPELREYLNKQCNHERKEHCECRGLDAHASENYTPEVADAVHGAWKKHCHH